MMMLWPCLVVDHHGGDVMAMVISRPGDVMDMSVVDLRAGDVMVMVSSRPPCR